MSAAEKNTLENVMANLITPPTELVEQWREKWSAVCGPFGVYIATRAARWGADQELEACVEFLRKRGVMLSIIEQLRAARRPKPPSLKGQALEELENMVKAAKDFGFGGTDPTAIRRALEALPNG